MVGDGIAAELDFDEVLSRLLGALANALRDFLGFAVTNPDLTLLVTNNDERVKLLGDGEVSKAFTVEVDKVSDSAKSKIEAAGGKIVEVAPTEAVSSDVVVKGSGRVVLERLVARCFSRLF